MSDRPNVSENVQGASILYKLMPELHELQHVQTSALHAERKLGNLAAHPKREVAIGHHLARLDNLIEKGDTAETRLWETAVSELVINDSDIPDTYWQRHAHGIDYEDKAKAIQNIQRRQRISAGSWAHYLKNSGDQYPTWFKYYAWDGFSRMGRFNPDKNTYYRRDSSTVAPYPRLNPAALAKVYAAIVNDDIENEGMTTGLLATGNFNQIYSHYLQNERHIIPVPENPTEVKGVWKTYIGNGMAAELSEAAQATPWCIASEVVANDYLEDGNEFYLFHLQDPDTSETSTSAVASIRLRDGYVQEISGLLEDASQIIHVSLIPEVENKLLQLPGGDEFIEELQAQKWLAGLRDKLASGDKLDIDQLKGVHFGQGIPDIYYVNDVEHIMGERDILDDMKAIYETEDIMTSLIRDGKTIYLVDNIDSFPEFSRLEIAQALISAGEQGFVLRCLQAFGKEDVINQVALLVLESGYTQFSSEQLELISDSDVRTQIVTRVLQSDKLPFDTKEIIGGASELDASLAISLIESGEEIMVIRKIAHFDNHSTIAEALMATSKGFNLVSANIDSFNNLSFTIANKLIQAGKGLTVARSIKRFDERAHDAITNALVQAGAVDYVQKTLSTLRA